MAASSYVRILALTGSFLPGSRIIRSITSTISFRVI
nr:MAG TPA: hypothetical protein [Bacteriophage sp.]